MDIDKVNKNNIDDYIEEYKSDLDKYNYLVELKDNYLHEELDISLNIDKDPYIKKISDDLVVNVTGESGSGKSTLVNKYLDDPGCIVIDTDLLKDGSGIYSELRKYFNDKFGKTPSLIEEFDLFYTSLIDYFRDSGKMLIIDSAQYRNIKDINNLIGEVIVIRTCINTCYQRCLDRYEEIHSDVSFEEKSDYANRKKGMFTWYKSINEFIYKLDKM